LYFYSIVKENKSYIYLGFALQFIQKYMSNKIYYSLILLLLYGLSSSAQTKKWTLEECVNYALQNNISIKQTELDIKTAAIDKRGAIGNFLPSLNGNASHSWNIGLNQI